VTLLLLVRHGLTDATGKQLTGWAPGVHLSEKGEQQAERVGERLAGLPLAAIYSSPLERCRETARPLAATTRLSVRVRPALGELKFGAWTGRSLRQLSRTKLWGAVQTAPSRARFPEGESVPEAQERAVAEIERIARDHPKDAVAVFSHADVIKLALAWFMGVHIDLFQRLTVSPASVSAIVLGFSAPRIVLVNDTGDLGDLAPTRSRRRPPKLRG
jgi:probable phosphomutase (TIGR03848 family)